MMVLLELFISFLKIGFTSFGGLSMIPLITSEMTSHGWMTAAEVSDIVAIAEMTPGPLGLNCATFAGMRTAGFLGAIAANLGTLSPTLTVCLLASIFFERFRTSNFMTKVMTGVRPACVGMIFGVIFSLCMTNYAANLGGISWQRTTRCAPWRMSSLPLISVCTPRKPSALSACCCSCVSRSAFRR